MFSSSVSKPKAAPVMDSPRRITSSGGAPRAETAAQSTAKPSPARPSNPALLAHGGGSGFDRAARLDARGLGTGAAPSTPGTGGATGAGGVSATGSVDRKYLDRLFNKGSTAYEGILKSLGVTNLPTIDDPAQRVINRSSVLGDLLTKDPSLLGKISQRDLRTVARLDRLYAAIQPQVSGIDRVAVDAFRGTAAMLSGGGGGDWPPPGGRGW